VNLRAELPIRGIFLLLQVHRGGSDFRSFFGMKFRPEECTADTEIGEFTQTSLRVVVLVFLLLFFYLFDIVTAGIE
jgi:hypothetical protein